MGHATSRAALPTIHVRRHPATGGAVSRTAGSKKARWGWASQTSGEAVPLPRPVEPSLTIERSDDLRGADIADPARRCGAPPHAPGGRGIPMATVLDTVRSLMTPDVSARAASLL